MRVYYLFLQVPLPFPPQYEDGHGGEAHHTPGGHPQTPWGRPTLGYRTRKKGKKDRRAQRDNAEASGDSLLASKLESAPVHAPPLA